MMNTIGKRFLSLLLVVLMLASVVPLTVLTAFAADSKTPTPEPAKPAFVPYSELSQKMSKDAIAGIYVDGTLVYEELQPAEGESQKIKVFKEAITKWAPSTHDKNNKRLSDMEIAALSEVRIVLNKDLTGKIDYIDRINGVKLVIDLNGRLLYSAPNGTCSIGINNGAHVTVIDSNPNTVHIGNINKTTGAWIEGVYAAYPLFGGVISGNLKDTALVTTGNAILVKNSSELIIRGGNVAGFTRNSGSVIQVESGSSLSLLGKTAIQRNLAADGAAIGLYSKATLTGEKTAEIRYNNGTKSGAGVIVKENGVTIENVYITRNYTAGEGAGIYAHKDCTIKNVSVIYNKSAKDGAGIYLKKGGTVEDCTVNSNVSNGRGGGIAVASGTLSLEGGTITENGSYSHGGGVLVKPDAKVSVSGLLVIKNNDLRPHAVASNLYLQGNNDLVPGSLKIGSEIWIRTGKSAAEYSGKGKTLTEGGHAHRTGISPSFFYADNSEYYVDLNLDTSHKNYRSLYLKKGTRPVYKDVKVLDEYSTIELATSYKTKSGLEYPLYKGYFEYNLMTTSEYYSASPFYYSDGYFAEDPKVYNEHLATMSINLAVAAFGRGFSDVGKDNYSNHFANVKQLFADIGCEDSDFYANDDYQNEPTFYGEDGRLSTIGVAMSMKTINVGDKNYTLIPVAIRGGSYEVEWASNVTIGKEGEAKGFADAADQVYAEIQKYMKKNGLDSRAEEGMVKFWVVGYSRAGATTNLTSKRLVDNYGAAGNHVYGYSFEAPMGGVEEAKVIAPHTDNGDYLSLHNTINENDFVTLVAPTEMGFIRYGVDHLVGSNHEGGAPVSYDKNSTYWKQREKMAAQLAAINPYYVFDDYWTAADINIFLGLGGKADLTEPENTDNKDYTSMYKGLRAFFLRVQKYGLSTSDKSKFREKYATATPLKGKKNRYLDKSYESKDVTSKEYFLGQSSYSVQEGVQTLMQMMYTHPHLDEILSIMMNNFNTRLDNKSLTAQVRFLGQYTENWNNKDIFGIDYRPNHVNELLHMLCDPLKSGDKTIWSYMSATEQVEFANALPIVIYFLCEYINEDYQGRFSTTLCTGSFVHNMDAIISNHYQEVSVAWVRSYDSYYENDLQAYKIDAKTVEVTDPEGLYIEREGKLNLSAQPGSSIFYSVNEGKSWELYTEPIPIENKDVKVLAYSVYRGAKSGVAEPSLNAWTGSLFGNGNVWFVIAGGVVITAGVVVTVEVMRRRKKKQEK